MSEPDPFQLTADEIVELRKIIAERRSWSAVFNADHVSIRGSSVTVAAIPTWVIKFQAYGADRKWYMESGGGWNSSRKQAQRFTDRTAAVKALRCVQRFFNHDEYKLVRLVRK